MSQNPYESPRELPLPAKVADEDHSLEAEIKRKMLHVAIYATMIAVAGIVALLGWIFSL